MNFTRLLFIGLSVFFLSACNKKPTLFRQIPSSHTGITFNNKIVENDTINPIDVVNIYNGGGVGIGDFNNDGLQDVYFSGNMVSSKLYLNKGDFKFEDITERAGVEGKGRWARGVSVVDINNDGLMDIYICNTIWKDSSLRRNILYINQGNDKDGLPRFKDMAAEYGLDVHVQSTMANFFDYDNDSDLDVYITVNEASSENNPSAFGSNRVKSSTPSIGKLYRNDMSAGQHHPIFQDVSKQAGISLAGFGHGAIIADINVDGWKDIYVANDFLSGNILYINNQNGSFTDRSKEYFKHTSYNSMGLDIVDVSNDGLADVFELDMSPPDNFRRKMMLNANNYNTIQNFIVYGYQYQYVRNTLQINQGARMLENDSVGSPVFSEISLMSGVAHTDWSWAPLITDFNNDSYRDIIITNGFPKDVTDHDFIAYSEKSKGLTTKADLLQEIPEVKLHNFAFQNTTGTIFQDVTNDWGFSTPSFSNGGAYADLDNDGDLDIVINNINDEAFIYQNLLRQENDTSSNFLQIKLEGDTNNRNGLGAIIKVYYDRDKQQIYEHTPYRGYLSSQQNIAHFGLGKVSIVDSIVVSWTKDKVQVLENVKANQVLKVNITNAGIRQPDSQRLVSASSLFKEVTEAAGIEYKHKDFDFIDFNIQPTLPHKLSEYCPALAAGDLDGNGLDDMVIGGNFDWPARVFLQQENGKFLVRNVSERHPLAKEYKDGGLLLLDVNGDNSLDLYIASSGYKFERNSINYADRLYLNDGKGNFTLATDALPSNYTSKLCVRAMDYNKDGKLDLFLSGRVDPWHYPRPVSSFIYRNDSQSGKAKFTDVTLEVAPELSNVGMICDALFTDFDNDQQIDIILAGEWMPVTFLKNTNGKFRNVTANTGLANQSGWWNSIVAGDFRRVGRTDYIVGNTGLNTFYKASEEYPVYVTAKDFDKNGGYEVIPSVYFPDQDGKLKEFPAHGRDDVIEKMPFMKKRFNNYRSFATVTMNEILTPEMRKDALRLKATNLQSCYIRNDGAGKFTIIPLPPQAQISTLNGMVADDYDADGNLDVLISGNDYGTEVSVGRYDALNGLLLKGNGKGEFLPLSIQQSGIYIPGDGKALVKLSGAAGNYLVAASQNRDVLKLFELRSKMKHMRVNPADAFALVKYKDGKTEKVEFYHGSSFLSQSARFICVNNNVSSIEITDNTGHKRSMPLQ